jgi:hypothetical protein
VNDLEQPAFGGQLMPINLSDGSANAPSGASQFSTLLNGYAARPAWNVAGVDYAVGYAAGTVLKDPMTAALPAGVTRDAANHTFLITGNNVVLSGWDFSLEGGWQVMATNANNPIISNNYFKIGANGLQPISLLGVPNGYTGQGATIVNNVIDGNNVDIGGQALIATSRGGTFVIQYNLIQNSGCDLIDAGADTLASGVVTTYDVRYNVLKNAGQQTSGHPDWFQTFANNHYNNITIDYNTVIQTGYPPGGGSQGFTLDGNANAPLATFDGGSVSNNTIIVTSTPVGATGYAMRFSTDLINGTFTVANNYIDASGLSNGGINYDIRQSIAGGPYHGTIKSFGDVNMVTGAVIAPNGFENNTTAVNPPPSGVVAPTIALFTTDSGVAGDHITNDSTLTLSGNAVANSTVNIFDGGKLLNSVVATASGAWSYTTTTLTNGAHSFTATDMVSGVTSAASGALSVTVDTAAPAAPVIIGNTIVNTNTVQLTGTAEANSKVTVFDGATALGTATANASGAWSYTTGPLSAGPNAFTARAADAAGNTSAASSALTVTVTAPSGTVTPPSGVGAPTIASFTTDSGVAGDHITNDSTLTLSGSAVANSTVNIFDGGKLLNSVVATASGAWSYTTGTMANGSHSFTATDTVSGVTSAASGALNVTVDTAAPAAPVITGDTIVNTNRVQLTGTAEANSKVTVFDGATALGTATADASGAWSYTTGPLSTGPNAFTATAADVAGNTSAVSQLYDPIVGGTVIEGKGAISLTQVGDQYYLDASTGAIPPTLKISGIDHLANMAGIAGQWTPIAAETTATGYEVAWKGVGTNQYTVMNTDNNGNYVSSIGVVSGNSNALMSLENSFHQDLNGDGHIGVSGTGGTGGTGGTVIESNGATSLTQVGDQYYLYDSKGVGPSLKISGVDHLASAAGIAGMGAPIAAEKTATGYEVAWKATGTDQYTIWNTDNNGNYVSSIGVVSGNSPILQAFENSFHQDLNGDGRISPPATVLDGHLGNQTLTAAGGPTVLVGGPRDTLNGGAGADMFVFPQNFGAETVKNFTPGTDALVFSQAMFANVAAVLADAHQVGSNVVIAHDPQNVVTLQNLQLTNLHASDIHIL